MEPSVLSVPSLCALTAQTAGNVAFLGKTCQCEEKDRVWEVAGYMSPL
jgi:hypothetical protein